jgi:TPR repeat protein
MRLDGAGVPKEEASGIAAIRAACDAGSALGCGALGQLYVVDRHGVAVDAPRAIELLERACHGGDAQGCNVLGGVYGIGERVPADPTLAAWYSARACDLGGSVGCLANGMAATTRADAETWLARACGMGNPEGCMALGSVRAADGEGQDRDGSIAAVSTACQLGLGDGCAMLQSLGAPLPPGVTPPPVVVPAVPSSP